MRTIVSPAQLRSRRGRVVYWSLLVVLLAAFTLAFLFPLYWAATGAMKSADELARTPPTPVPQVWHPESYVQAWQQMDLGRYFLNTVVVAGGAWLVQLAVDVPAAFALSKLRPKFGNAVLGLMLATLMLPASALLVPTYLTVADVPLLHLNLLNNPAAIWLPAAANAFNIYVLKRFFDQIPDELTDAARIDGAGPVRILLRIVLPISRPILAVVSIFSIVAAWKDFIWPLLVFPDPERQTLSVLLQRVAIDMPLNLLVAGLVLASVPMVALFLVFQRQILAGLGSGALKG
ncbi:multiple sugar transport system permease protein [Amycolatopsis bartoniae]|uniref:Sugar ABC transporter permease n=1 Tax=Amycolatopsis bartoniae TaxID=941986 RepID=A0A8H9ISE1_9PSEU|nr:carbohydrate ABC transporter permease [Amycolatopsis bartoniae]MBB2937757.1 multiple sugar transport system permease protein [Amycolatopsis bartoniae]TVT08164.1 carbohydrate ABC transporter permease [Amycolatopsis bartoniae]GHF40493.1 sugar ABC transporter permease [Amycolatopsis bartoniae]